MSTALAEAFAAQGRACESLGSPFMGRLMPLIGARLTRDTAVGARLLDWPGDVGASAQSLPLRLAGGLHGLVLDGIAPELARSYPPQEVPDEVLWQAVKRAFHDHEARLMAWLDRAPQTNEVRRAGAVLPAIWTALAGHDLPVVLSEMGASAGLNLAMDRFALEIDGLAHGATDSVLSLSPEWRGAARPEPRGITVIDRAGVDLSPLDARDPGDVLRLLAYLWPDQPDRIARTRAAIAVAETRVHAGDAAGWLEGRLDNPHPGALHVVYTTIAAQYFPEDTKAQIAASLAEAGACATETAPLAHVAMETDGQPGSAALTLTRWPGGASRELARVDYHGRWIMWHE